MKRYISLLMSLLAFIPISAQQSDYYYYYKGNRIDLEVDSTRLYVVSEGMLSAKATASAKTRMADYNVKESTKSYVYNHVVPLQQRRNAVPEVYFSTVEVPKEMDGQQYEALIKKIRTEENVWQVLPSFKLEGKRVNATNYFFVELKSANDFNKLQAMADQYKIEIVGYNEFLPLWFTLSCSYSSTLNAIEAANLFYTSGEFACSEPNFCFRALAESGDALYEKQWALDKDNVGLETSDVDINVEEAWEVTKGAGVTVAVFDNGVATTHPDLIDNICTYSYDTKTNTSPAVLVLGKKAEGHGTECAGVIAAAQNELGISGVAPEAKIMPISIDLEDCNKDEIVNGFLNAAANGADIISCSWGSIPYSSFIDSAIKSVLDLGRNRKGTVIVFSAGNDGSELKYPKGVDPRIILAGAVTSCGERLRNGACQNFIPNFNSYYGDKLDVVAPGFKIITTDIPGLSGYTDGDYDEEFCGTSAACPFVSGVAALVLSIYPKLPVDDVAQVIERTAQKVRTDIYTYSSDTVHWSGTWNNEMGYGLIDAGAAVTTPLKELLVSRYRNQVVDPTYNDGCFQYNVEAENVRVLSPDGFLELGAEKRVLIKSSFFVEKGAGLHIYNVIYNEEDDWWDKKNNH